MRWAIGDPARGRFDPPRSLSHHAMVVVFGLLVFGAVIVVTLVFVNPVTRTIYCDGAYPVWMLQAQDYQGGGCVEVLPSSEAPVDADWRHYCVGLCDPAEYPANQEYSFGP